MAPLVELARVRYAYPEAASFALDSVTMALEGGLLCAVTGPSGGGKSTLLRLLNGLVPHMYGGRIGGRVTVDGFDVIRTATRRMATSVGFVFQDAERQAVHATVERDIAFGLENLGCDPSEMRRRVHDIAERLSITALLGRSISTLSGGERQRVAVAGALVLKPRLLVLDEPFSQLDAGGSAALLQLCVDLRDAGTAVVVTEHRLDDLLPAVDAMVTVRNGCVRGPSDPGALAAGLDSAPQVVRLSVSMGWRPTVLTTRDLPVAVAAGGRTRRTHPLPPSPPRGDPAWELDGVSGGPGSLLNEVSIAGSGGEVIAVVGANGAGKTTLLRLVAGLLTPSGGRVRRQPGRIAYLPQNPGALLHRETVAAEIAWTSRGGGARGGSAGGASDDARITTLLGVDQFLDSDPRDLSSGQRQRAAVAAVLAGGPRTVLLDEPTRGMDGRARDALVAATRELAARGASVVVATHDTDLAASVADRVLVVEDGTVHDRGHPTRALSGDHPYATQLGRCFASPGPVTVAAVARLLADVPRAEVAAP
jgi:energy-coupling factor transporter ATP-binding protein EcfA2